MTVQSIELDRNWEWKQRDKSVPSVLEELSITKSEDGSDDAQGLRWRAATAFPSEVHVELLKAGMIPDPYVEFNEHKVQCASLSFCPSGCEIGVHMRCGFLTSLSGFLRNRGRNGGMVVQDDF